MPDLLGYWLTGVMVAERHDASTTGLLDSADRRAGTTDLVARLGLDPSLLPPARRPRTVRGPLLPPVREATGLAGRAS